jgi:hypothetical protein
MTDLPVESSFITKLADKAIAAEGGEALMNRERSRFLFSSAFLGGYSNPGATTTDSQNSSIGRLSESGFIAGRGYRLANPDAVADVMNEYGYKTFEGVGTYEVGFEAGYFRPNHEPIGTNISLSSCMNLFAVQSTTLATQLQQTIPRDAYQKGASIHVHVEGYVSSPNPPDPPSAMNMCPRQLYVTGVSAETK